MMNNNMIRGAVVATACAAACFGAMAQQQKPANEQVVVPQVDRRDIQVPKFPSNDFEIGLFAGTYATQNFGTSAVGGVKLGYHITDRFIARADYTLYTAFVADTHITDRFIARADYTLYTAFVADTRSTEYRAWTLGLSFFF